jgi:protein-disulfide isomerase
MHSHWTLAVSILLTLGCAASGLLACAGSSATDSRVVASGGGVTITLDELDTEVKERLFQQETRGGEASRVYDLRREALEAMVRNQVLAAESTKRDVTVDELVASQTPAVAEEDVDAFFQENQARMGGATLEQVGPRIRELLSQRNASDAVTALVEESGVKIALEPPRFEVDPIGPSRGPSDAPVTIVEFSDFQCPYCSRAVPIVDALVERHPEDVRVVYRHLPLEQIHPRARDAAVAAGCAEDQGKFWVYHDGLFENPGKLSDEDLARLAGETGLDTEAFAACYAARTPEARVDADIAAAKAAGLSSTPAFLVNGILLKGAQPVEAFERVIAQELQAAKNPTP